MTAELWKECSQVQYPALSFSAVIPSNILHIKHLAYFMFTLESFQPYLLFSMAVIFLLPLSKLDLGPIRCLPFFDTLTISRLLAQLFFHPQAKLKKQVKEVHKLSSDYLKRFYVLCCNTIFTRLFSQWKRKLKRATWKKEKKKMEDFLKSLLWTKPCYICVILGFQQLQNVLEDNNMQLIYS